MIMGDGFFTMTEAPEGHGQRVPRAHVGSGLEQPPERTGVVLEVDLAQRFCADSDGSPVEFERLAGIGGFLREHEMGVRAER